MLVLRLIILLTLTFASNSIVVELLKQNIWCKDINKFIDIDTIVWTTFLQKQPGFINKKYLFDPTENVKTYTNCSVYQYINWLSRNLWKSIDNNMLLKTNEEFIKKFGYEPLLTAIPTDDGFDVYDTIHQIKL